MTRYEKAEFKNWNTNIGRRERIACDSAKEIMDKYMNINGHRACSDDRFIFEIATTEKVPQEERIRDIRKYLSCIMAFAQADALLDILHIQNN